MVAKIEKIMEELCTKDNYSSQIVIILGGNKYGLMASGNILETETMNLRIPREDFISDRIHDYSIKNSLIVIGDSLELVNYRDKKIQFNPLKTQKFANTPCAIYEAEISQPKLSRKEAMALARYQYQYKNT